MTITEKRQMIRVLKATNLYYAFCGKMHDFYKRNKFIFLSEAEIFDNQYSTEQTLIHCFLTIKQQEKYRSFPRFKKVF